MSGPAGRPGVVDPHHYGAPPRQVARTRVPNSSVRWAANMYGIVLGTNVCRPMSRGTLRLQSADPRQQSLIDLNYLAEPQDLERAIDAIEVARAIASAPALKKVLQREFAPGATLTTRSDLADYIRKTGRTDYHPVGTCRMGSDSLAVVDQSLRVHGLEGLRVCDSSVMPTKISGNTNAPTIMIAERVADLIKHDAQSRRYAL